MTVMLCGGKSQEVDKKVMYHPVLGKLESDTLHVTF
jgi:hypothetical protein